ncbi:DUF1566 domain-containing protein [uncultured Paraglaciecola sp.]|uniref:Lcl domain-containing protein n=2 Tax=Paraglaciecola TaxID=1621534 RepID=UPI00259A0B98|nr:DUF1566 domain-containing protein [uncultured Paraglaciecola sp.]
MELSDKVSRFLDVGVKVLALILILSSCGGDSGSSEDSSGSGGTATGGSTQTPTTYTITSSVAGEGTINPSAQTVDAQTTFFTLTSDAGYAIDSVTGCSGTLEGNIFQTDQFNTQDCSVDVTFTPNDQEPSSDSIGAQRTLVALINFPDNKDETMSLEDIKNLIRDNDNSLNQFLVKNSNGKAWIEAEFLDWVTLEQNSTSYFNENSDLYYNDSFHDDAISKLSQTTDLTHIDRIMLIVKDGYLGNPGCYAYKTPITLGNNNEFTGYLTVTGGYDMGCNRAGRIAHEFGHTFGFDHSSSHWCDGVSPVSFIDTNYLGKCSFFDSYSKFYDTMGSDTYNPMIANVWRHEAGWFEDSQVVTAEESGTYTLEQSSSSSSGVKLIKVPIGTGLNEQPLYYYLELRNKSGVFDNSKLDEVARDYEFLVRFSDFNGTDHLRDLYQYATLFDVGLDYVDEYRGVSFSVESLYGSGSSLAADIKIDVPRFAVAPQRVYEFSDPDDLEKTFSVKNVKAVQSEVTSVQVTGRNADAFEVKSDACTGVTLDVGDECSISIERVGLTGVYASIIVETNFEKQVIDLSGLNVAVVEPYDPDALIEWEDNKLPEGPEINWYSAVAYCEELTLNANEDWRLPRIEELRAALQLAEEPLFVLTVEENVSATLLWSITEPPDNPLNAYMVYGNGTAFWSNDSKDSFARALCVRSL